MGATHPEGKPGTQKSWGSQLYRFLYDLSGGDHVVTYDCVFRAEPTLCQDKAQRRDHRLKAARALV